MKAFYSTVAEELRPSVRSGSAGPGSQHPSRARVAIYDAPGAAPRVVEVEPAPTRDYIENLASTVYRLACERGGSIPYSVVREISENFIHAAFREPVISILNSGAVIRFADRGPGICDKERAVLPGFTSATSDMKCFIRGVGSGLPLVRDFLEHSGGSLVIEDNLGHGAVVTVSAGSGRHAPLTTSGPRAVAPAACGETRSDSSLTHDLFGESEEGAPVGIPPLSTRQKQVLALVMESGSAGPSLVSRELAVGVSTAYRDLASLEEMGLIEADGGKRTLTDRGLSYLDDLTRSY